MPLYRPKRSRYIKTPADAAPSPLPSLNLATFGQAAQYVGSLMGLAGQHVTTSADALEVGDWDAVCGNLQMARSFLEAARTILEATPSPRFLTSAHLCLSQGIQAQLWGLLIMQGAAEAQSQTRLKIGAATYSEGLTLASQSAALMTAATPPAGDSAL